ncbi:IQ-domain 20 [Heracleum sosnowskyi]|uniref:IQ-domain 20 n=1 Tax=Heracleum sosnowskyi TaxID=360622 RepID=A0AAD8HU84_9APIA|nr:IQ-domain 20 [Heracleum sosnowskyi]
MKHKSKKWFSWRKSFGSSRQETTLTVHLKDIKGENTSREDDDAGDLRILHKGAAKLSTPQEDDAAAIVIQVHFRRHLARRAFRALRSLVKLQALVRGVCARRQARIALDCMHALARLQVNIRARQLLSSSN